MRVPPPLFQRVMRLGSLKHKDGNFYIWGSEAIIHPTESLVYLYQLMRKQLGEDKVNKIQYQFGYNQAYMGVQIVCNKFGFAKTIKEKKRLMEFQTGQLDILGLGPHAIKRIDLEKNFFVVEGNPNYSKIHSSYFGKKKGIKVDYFQAGLFAGASDVILSYKDGKIHNNFSCIETQCVAEGYDKCVFEVRLKEDMKKCKKCGPKDKFIFEDVPNYKDLGAIRDFKF